MNNIESEIQECIDTNNLILVFSPNVLTEENFDENKLEGCYIYYAIHKEYKLDNYPFNIRIDGGVPEGFRTISKPDYHKCGKIYWYKFGNGYALYLYNKSTKKYLSVVCYYMDWVYSEGEYSYLDIHFGIIKQYGITYYN